jgi:hypothetical protein
MQVSVAALAVSTQARAEIPTAAALAKTLEEQQAKIQSIDIEYKDISEDLVNPNNARLYNQRVRLVTDFELIYLETINPDKSELDGVIPHTRMLYDGQKVIELRPEGKEGDLDRQGNPLGLALVRRPDSSFGLLFPCAYLGCASVGYPDPSRKVSDSDYEKDQNYFGFVPPTWLLRQPNVKVREDLLDGQKCLVIEYPGRQNIWLAPSMEYAVLKKEIYENKKVTWVQLSKNFSLFNQVLHLPQTVEYFSVGKAKPTSMKYQGYFIEYRHIMSLESAKLNGVREAREFLKQRVKVKPGTFMVDRRVTPIGPDGREIKADPSVAVGYRQPRDERDIDSVVTTARHLAGERVIKTEQRERRAGLLTAFNVFGVGGLVVALVLGLRSRRKLAPGEGVPGTPL